MWWCRIGGSVLATNGRRIVAKNLRNVRKQKHKTGKMGRGKVEGGKRNWMQLMKRLKNLNKSQCYKRICMTNLPDVLENVSLKLKGKKTIANQKLSDWWEKIKMCPNMETKIFVNTWSTRLKEQTSIEGVCVCVREDENKKKFQIQINSSKRWNERTKHCVQL